MPNPHAHILARIYENSAVPGPNYGGVVTQRPGDSKTVAEVPKKEGEEFKPTGEETREVDLANRILRAAKAMAKTPDVDEIIRCADELKKLHGVTEARS